ncbi:MAG: ABC transporter ATP-binding protein [Leptospiraceae bacterium]|nr:ABC transporter ATP-binding protein [Leptospiraceae bacterium]
MTTNEKLIEISKLEILAAEKRKTILGSFDFELKKGETHSIIGESGSGKTTFILSLFSLLSTNLKIEFEKFILLGKNYFDYNESDWTKIRGKKISLIPQNPSVSFHPYIKIGSQIQEYLNYRSATKFSLEEIIQAFEKVGIQNAKEKINKFPKEVSGGERQRILIASSLLADPEILVADEPTSSMDPINTKLILDLFKTAVSEKKTGLILVSHDMHLVRSIADRVTIIKNGITIESTICSNRNLDLQNDYSKSLFSLTEFYKHSG